MRIDTLLVLAFAAALAAAFPSAAELRASRPRAVPPPAIELRLATGDPSAFLPPGPPATFSPTLFAFGADGFLPSDDSVPEPEAATEARRAPQPPGAAASADEPLPVPLPESALATRLDPSPRPFSGPRRTPAPAAAEPAAPARPAGEMTLFYDPGAALPTVVVDAPGLAPSEIPALEARAFSMRLPPAETARVVRVAVP